MTDAKQITSENELRSVYRAVSPGAQHKVIDHVDPAAAEFIAKSPFAVVATSTDDRADASPRGGPPGFVRVLSPQQVAWGDLTGNNRLDTFGNLMERPHIGLTMLIPGLLETLRLRGRAKLVRDQATLEACAIDGRLPKTAIVIDVIECYIQCGAAVRRADLWDTSTWLDEADRPSGAAILKAHIGTSDSVESIADGLDTYYENHIWAAGGADG